jgi:hypothetical protein
MKTRIACLGALALCGVLGAPTAANAAMTPTSVTIKYLANGGFEGTVKSRVSACVKNRTVKVYKVGRRSPLYTDTSDNLGKWNTGNSGRIHGDFYAATAAKGTCAAGKSPTIHT